MEKRGRKSSASLMIAPNRLEVIDRQRPPHDLTDEEVEIWQGIVHSEPADWFSPSTVPLLAQYCRHVIHARRVAEIIERSAHDLLIEDYDRLLKMQERESRAIASLATKMRISQQGTTNHRGNKNSRPSVAKKPWEYAG